MNPLRTLIKYIRFWGGSRYCNVCQRRVRTFFPFSDALQRDARTHGFPLDFCRMETLNVDNCNCPFCLSSDRERLYLLYLTEFLAKHPGRYRVLDFAPNPAFASRLKALPGIEYRSADLFRSDVDLKLDVCRMDTMPDGSFDIVICSHVLEHVPDPDSAMRELRRILDPAGWSIIMVPLFSGIEETAEEAGHTAPEQRTRHYGQFDHVRLFGRGDFLRRLKNAGMAVRQVVPAALNAADIERNAIAANSILYVCTRS